MFEVKYSSRAKKFLQRADKRLSARILEKIEKLREAPIIHDTKKIVSSTGLFRIRVGNYRILYEVDFKDNLIGIVKIDKRSSVY